MKYREYQEGQLEGRVVTVCKQCARYAFRHDGQPVPGDALIHERWCDAIEGLKREVSGATDPRLFSRTDWNR